MTVFSKILPYFTTTLSCHELAHTWTPSCTSASAGVFRSCFIESLKIYGLLYLVGGILRRAGMKYFRVNYLLDVIRSSLFLAVNGGGLVVNVCLIRKLFGSFNYLSMIFVPGLIASLMAILIEKKGRRSTLALYMTNLATETTYNMLKERSLIKPIPNGEIILFCASTATMMYLYRKKDGLTDGLVNALISVIHCSNNAGLNHGGKTRSGMEKQCSHNMQSSHLALWSADIIVVFSQRNNSKVEKIISWLFVFLAYRICPLILKLQNASDGHCNRIFLTENKARWTIDPVYRLHLEIQNNVITKSQLLPTLYCKATLTSLRFSAKHDSIRMLHIPNSAEENCLKGKSKTTHYLGLSPDCTSPIFFRYFLGSNNSGHRQEISGTEQTQLMERKKYNNDWHINWLQPTLKALGTGYVIQLMLMLAGQIKFIVTNPRRLLRTFYHKDCIRCGLFLGSFVAIFKNVEWVLGNLRKKSDEINALFAGGLAGLSMMFYKSSTIALYLASKMSEIVYKQGVSAGVLPSIPYAEILTYTFSTAFLFHACTWEVHSVRPSYWRYLNVVTGKRLEQTHYSLMYYLNDN
ncbi:unnamed protein product [Porites lobata]|uniref:Transmembrane protein 135 N-terminal domain-containing protein n=1 Tax=Porites lobata TaxID=104759 RepID=A0ABN8PXR6_9CNID|nr:unnamed protein product [Porites lobata]